MASMLDFRTPAVKAAARHPALAGLPKLARGAFCAVYDKGDTVLKLTSDPIQAALLRDCYRPEGPHFPHVVEDFGCVGETHDGYAIYLVEVERLKPVGRAAPKEVKRLADRLVSETHASYSQHMRRTEREHKWSRLDVKRHASIKALDEMGHDAELPQSLRTAFTDLADFLTNYDATTIDFHRKNLMLRGDTIILNDVVADAAAVDKLWEKDRWW